MTDSPTPALLSDEQIAEIARLNALPYEAITPECVSALIGHAIAASAALADAEGVANHALDQLNAANEEVEVLRAASKGDWVTYHDQMLGRIREGNDRERDYEATIARQAAEIAEYKRQHVGPPVRNVVTSAEHNNTLPPALKDSRP